MLQASNRKTKYNIFSSFRELITSANRSLFYALVEDLGKHAAKYSVFYQKEIVTFQNKKIGKSVTVLKRRFHST